MADIERTYTIPLRRSWLKTPKYRRSKKAVTTVKEFLIKHMKCKNVRIGEKLNEHIWKDGIKNPPGQVKVIVRKTKKDDEDIVYSELFGEKIDVKEKKSEESKSLADKLGVKKDSKKESKSEDKRTDDKKDVKVDNKEAKVEPASAKESKQEVKVESKKEVIQETPKAEKVEAKKE